MKKAIIIILAVLLLFSFTSCNKDKTDEVVSNFVAFWDAAQRGSYVEGMFVGLMEDASAESTNKSFSVTFPSEDGIEQGNLENYWEMFINDYTDRTAVSRVDYDENKVTGSVSGTYTDEYNYSLTINTVVIPYKVEDSSETVLKTGNLTISGSLSQTVSENVCSYVYNLNINGTSYNCECKYSEATGEFISAVYDGKEVDIRLVSAYVDGQGRK